MESDKVSLATAAKEAYTKLAGWEMEREKKETVT
jgi:hypothetical protein